MREAFEKKKYEESVKIGKELLKTVSKGESTMVRCYIQRLHL